MKKKSKYKLVCKALIIAILQDYICSLYAFLFYLLFSHAEYLFPDAELREDLTEDLVCGDFSGDGAQMEDRLPDLFAEQVGG